MNIIKKLDTKEQELAEENVISASLHERYITAREKYDQLIQKQKTFNKYLNAHPLEFTEEYDSLPQNIKELVCIFNSDMPDTDYSPNNTSILLQNTSDLLFTNLSVVFNVMDTIFSKIADLDEDFAVQYMELTAVMLEDNRKNMGY